MVQLKMLQLNVKRCTIQNNSNNKCYKIKRAKK